MTSTSAPRSATVLVVEDEPLIRFHIVDIVESAGFEAIEAASADAAIELLISRPDIRIVVTDVDMPGSMDGLKLACAVRDRWPPIDIIVMSGKSNPRDTDIPQRGLFLSKPVDERRFVRALREFVQ